MSAQNIIFSAGIEGSFELLPPFANAVRPNARYVVRSIRTMSNIIADGDDPRALYDKYAVPEADYVRDLMADMVILGLQATTGEWVYVPQGYVASYPQISGVSYRPLALVLPLSSIPDDKDLTNLMAYCETAVMRHLGVETKSRVSALGNAELITMEEHARITNARNAMTSTNESPAAITVRLEKENARLREENAMLKDAIKKLA